MNHSHLQNPFEVLHLDPTASIEEVVAQAGRLRQRAAGEAELTAIRQAVQLLTGSNEERFVQAMLTHPRPCYSWPALERFRATFRRRAGHRRRRRQCGERFRAQVRRECQRKPVGQRRLAPGGDILRRRTVGSHPSGPRGAEARYAVPS